MPLRNETLRYGDALPPNIYKIVSHSFKIKTLNLEGTPEQKKNDKYVLILRVVMVLKYSLLVRNWQKPQFVLSWDTNQTVKYDNNDDYSSWLIYGAQMSSSQSIGDGSYNVWKVWFSRTQIDPNKRFYKKICFYLDYW